MLIKAITKPKFPFIVIFKEFCSLSHPDPDEITYLQKTLEYNSFKSTIKDNHKYYVNKMKQLYKLMESGRSISIFRPRRMGKSTMINDLAFLYEKGKIFPYLINCFFRFK